MLGEGRIDCLGMPKDLQDTSQSSLNQLSSSSGALMSWTELGGEEGSSAASSASDLSVSMEGRESTVDAPHSSNPGEEPDSAGKHEASTSEASPLDLPLHYYNDFKSILCAKGAELEGRMNVLLAQLTTQHVNLPVLLVSSVLLFTVGVFIGRRSSPEVL